MCHFLLEERKLSYFLVSIFFAKFPPYFSLSLGTRSIAIAALCIAEQHTVGEPFFGKGKGDCR